MPFVVLTFALLMAIFQNSIMQPYPTQLVHIAVVLKEIENEFEHENWSHLYIPYARHHYPLLIRNRS